MIATPPTVSQRRNIILVLVIAGLALLLLVIHHFFYQFSPFPETWDINLSQPIDDFKLWVIGNRNSHPLFTLFFEPISNIIDFSLRRVEDFLLWLPWPVTLATIFLVAQKTTNLRVALLATFSLLFMGLVDLWSESMQTLALITTSVLISLLIGIPLGILAARYRKMETFMRPILDAMQTMPAFVYLIPVLLFFGIARVPSVVATVIYAIPPAIRLTTLGIQQVPQETIEAAEAFGSTRKQTLYKVQIPLALPTIMAGVNQTIMMALGIVVIAALIGAGGLGKIVLDSLRGLKVGLALEAGLAIVFMAVLLDRISYGFSNKQAQTNKNNFRLLPNKLSRYGLARSIEKGLDKLYAGIARTSQHLTGLLIQSVQKILCRSGKTNTGSSTERFIKQHTYFFSSLAFLLILLFVTLILGVSTFPETLRLPLYGPVDTIVGWMRDNLYEFELGSMTLGTGRFSEVMIIYLLDPLDVFLQEILSWPVFVLLIAILALLVSGWQLALFVTIMTFCLGLLGMWDLAMVTLSQVIVAVILSLIIAIPLGVWAARSDAVEATLRPILDLLQTIPTFVYLVPVIMLFNVGRVPGIMASVLYALPPAIRLTNLGIRRASPEAVEAAYAFGSTSWQTLFKVQLPLAMPSIMIGISQTIMMVLAMVVIAGMVGGAGLGLEAVNGLAKNQLGRGIEAGLAIVLLAIVIDRLMNAWANKYERSAQGQ